MRCLGRCLFLLFCLMLSSVLACAQTKSSTAALQPGWESLYRDWATSETMDFDEETFEQLSSLAANKINLNQLSRDALEQLPFLSARQIEEIIAYADRYKPIRTLNELMMVESLDPDTRALLSCFVYVGEEAATDSTWPSWATLNKYGHHTLLGGIKIPMYERKGDRSAYLGSRYRHELRYQFSYRDRVKWGLTAAQDAGEPFFAHGNHWGYDHYSYYLQLHHMGWLEELNVGMYRVQMGMGLVMNTGFHLGKLAVLQNMGRSSHTLTAHSSRSATGYLRGAAATFRLAPHWLLTTFASYRPLDATLNDDGTVRTIVTNGYHRTTSEMARKHNTHLTDLGLRLGWKATALGGLAAANVNAVYSHLDRSLEPYNGRASQRYRRYALSGTDFFHVSADYSYTHARLSVAGETAVSKEGALAVLHTVGYQLSDQWSLLLLHRYYDKRYAAFHAYGFSEGGSVQNEHGVYLGARWNPSPKTMLQAYVDYAHFPWARYQVGTSSESLDALLLARTFIYNSITVEGRYRFHLRQRDNTDHTLLQNRYEHRARLRATVPLSSLQLATQVDGVLLDRQISRSRGLMISQQAAYAGRWLRLDASVGWFHTDDYDSRLYQYEPSVLYDFSYPMYYGHGIRYALMARADVGAFKLSAKVSTTNYFDRAVISSGQQQVDRSSLTDLLLQVRYRF